MWTRQYWRAVAERAIKTFCQSVAAMLVGDGVGLLDVDWPHVLSVAGLATLISVLTSIASTLITGGGPSLTNAEVINPTPARDTSSPEEAR